jgi:hypothetical protein
MNIPFDSFEYHYSVIRYSTNSITIYLIYLEEIQKFSETRVVTHTINIENKLPQLSLNKQT